MNLHTREDYRALIETLVEPARRFYSPKGARLKLCGAGAHYNTDCQEKEGALRMLWALIPLWAGDPKEKLFRDVYKNAFRAGTDPVSDEFWGMPDRLGDQRFVEFAPMALGLFLCPELVLGGMSEEEKAHFIAYTNSINQVDMPINNWLFFRILMNAAKKKLGLPYSEENLEKDLREVEGIYIRDGWYGDGHYHRRDYYVAFAIHFYALIYAKEMNALDPERCARYRERAAAFALEFIHFFDKTGEGVPFGRSMIYRFAQVAFFSALAYAEVDALPLGVIKGVINRNLRFFLEKPIFDNAGILSVGYGYPNLNISEEYNGFGAPYWAMKAFLFLALPAEHPFYAAEELPYPVGEGVKALPIPFMLIQKTPTDTVILGGNQADMWGVHYPQTYMKFAYSTLFSFSCPRTDYSLSKQAPDSMLAFEYTGRIFVRQENRDFKMEDGMLYAEWSPFEGVVVRTKLIPKDNGHVREHTVISEVECKCYDCGFAIPFDDPKDVQTEGGDTGITLTSHGLRCRVEGLAGGGRPGYVECTPNSNLLYPHTVLPYVKHRIPVGETKFSTFVLGEKIK